MKLNLINLLPWLVLIGFNFQSCAPVKFSKSSSVKVDSNGTPTCSSGNCAPNQIKCDPKIVPNLISFTYSSAATKPSIESRCDSTNLNYEWVVKRSDNTVVTTAVPGLTGANPSQLDFTNLGPGSYYVFLTATDPQGVLISYQTTQPLEFVVPTTQPPATLSCDPKINGQYTSLVMQTTTGNPTISAGCTPKADSYTWTVKRDNQVIQLPSLTGDTSTPDINTLGPGVYQITLYATLQNSTHWQTTTPLTITINPPVNPPLGTIQCNPKINGNLTSVTLNASTTKPQLSANCVPADGTYQWVVKKDNNEVTMADLAGPVSTPDFVSRGTGTYLIYLTVIKNNYTTYTTTQPLTVVVDNSTPTTLSVNCNPKFSNNLTTISVTTSQTNPSIQSNCDPNTAVHVWNIQKNGQNITVPGLTGPAITPDVISLGEGVYHVYLNATLTGYNPYVIPNPLVINVTTAITPTRAVSFTRTVQVTDNKVDLLVVMDDSSSMAADNQKLASKMQGFITDLETSGIDWQMCITRTRDVVAEDGVYYWGLPVYWQGYVGTSNWILNRGAANPYSIFTNTVNFISTNLNNTDPQWARSDDERAIKAAVFSATYDSYFKCSRSDAALSVIIISDEDERSVGGDASQAVYSSEVKPLEVDDQPSYYVNIVKQIYGMNKRFTVNSIIVKPGDTTCKATQDSNGAVSHYGFKYDELSRLTSGYSSSICSTDYSTNLKYFKDQIVNSLSSVPLECTPIGNVDVQVTPTLQGLSARVENGKLFLSPAIPAGYSVNIKYQCPN